MKIIASAIKVYLPDTQNFVVFTGPRHANILHDLFRLRVNWDRDKSIQGFVTDTGDFLNRYTAKEHALATGQLKYRENETYLPELYSEDIWHPADF